MKKIAFPLILCFLCLLTGCTKSREMIDTRLFDVESENIKVEQTISFYLSNKESAENFFNVFFNDEFINIALIGNDEDINNLISVLSDFSSNTLDISTMYSFFNELKEQLVFEEEIYDKSLKISDIYLFLDDEDANSLVEMVDIETELSHFYLSFTWRNLEIVSIDYSHV